MSTSAVYSFKAPAGTNPQEIHLVYHSDGNPIGASELIPELLEVADRLRAGEQLDLDNLRLPRIDSVERRATLDESKPSTPFRYEIEIVDGRPVVTALRHQPAVPEELLKRVESARRALQEVEQEMFAALDAPTYVEIGCGSLREIAALGYGDGEE